MLDPGKQHTTKSKNTAPPVTVEHKTKAKAGRKRELKQVIVDKALAKIHKKHGRITPMLVLEEARAATSPLHQFFEWRDSVAAEKYRLDQATQMVLASKMVASLVETRKSAAAVPVQSCEVRSYVAPFRGQGFTMRNTAFDDSEAMAALVERKLSVLRSWCRETVDMPELAKVRAAVEEALRGFGS